MRVCIVPGMGLISLQDTAEDLHVVEKECGASIGSLKSPRWSIVIPVLNEEKDIKNTLADVLRVGYYYVLM